MSKMTKAIAVLGVVAGLGVAALPLSSYAAGDTADVVVSVTVPEGLSLTTSDSELDLGNAIPGGDVAKGSITATVAGNSETEKAYHITMQASGENGSMVRMEGGVATSDTIPDLEAGKALDGKTSAWGYSLDGTTFKHVPTIDDTDKTIFTSATGAAGGSTSIYFGVRIAAAAEGEETTAPGTYQNTVTLTAVAE